MQEGSFRCDANVSVRKKGDPVLSTRREIKNLNSFRFLQQAIEYEIRWQIETREDGGQIQQATVLFDPDKGETRVMRTKEDAHDYRYFPDPDLPPLVIEPAWMARVAGEMPELPTAMKARFMADWGLSAYDATTLTANRELALYYQATVEAAGAPLAKLCANWVMGEMAARLNKAEQAITDSSVSAAQLAGLVARIADNTISNAIGKKVFDALWNREGESADAIIEAQGLRQVTDSGAIDTLIDEVLVNNPKSVSEFQAGKEKAFNALVGQVMKASRGKANPAQVNERLRQKLDAL
jgi:aspartyl-tRNA(Asn)/glutamyl-tRNA(Gln) amidotransferase subunit B